MPVQLGRSRRYTRPHVLDLAAIQRWRTGAQPVVSVRNQPEAHFCLSPSLALEEIWVVLQAELPVSSLDLRNMRRPFATCCNSCSPVACALASYIFAHANFKVCTRTYCKRPASLYYVHQKPNSPQLTCSLLALRGTPSVSQSLMNPAHWQHAACHRSKRSEAVPLMQDDVHS